MRVARIRLHELPFRHRFNHPLKQFALDAHKAGWNAFAVDQFPERLGILDADRKAALVSLKRVHAAHKLNVVLQQLGDAIRRERHVVVNKHQVGAVARKEARNHDVAGKRDIAVALQKLNCRSDAPPAEIHERGNDRAYTLIAD